jgi:hypothetical protein
VNDCGGLPSRSRPNRTVRDSRPRQRDELVFWMEEFGDRKNQRLFAKSERAGRFQSPDQNIIHFA